jgi:hypothetical protein
VNPEDFQILNVRRLPAKIVTKPTAVLLGFQDHDIPVLVAEGLLIPVGNPTASCIKYFATSDVLTKSADRKWIHRATSCVYRHWRTNNLRRRKNQPSQPQP